MDSKLNFDGLKYNSNNIALGYLLRNHKSELVFLAAKKINDHSSILFAEALALREGVKQALALNINCLVIEGDNLAIINAIRSIWHVPWEIHSIIEDTKIDLSRFDSISVNHTYREANKDVDYLANLGHNFSIMTCWLYPYDYFFPYHP